MLFYVGVSSCYDIARIYGTDASSRASLSEDNQLPFPVDTSEPPRPSTSRHDAEESGRAPELGRPDVEATSPMPCSSRRRSSSPAAWPPRPAVMGLDGMDSDDDDDARPATYSSQVGESVDYRRDATPSPTCDIRGKQPATKSRVGVNVAAKNRNRQASVVTSDVVALSTASQSADDVEVTPPH